MGTIKNYHCYQLCLLTLAPVHIGNGNAYTQKEYLYAKSPSGTYAYYFPDLAEMYLRMSSQDRSEFEQFLSGDTRNGYHVSRLSDFVKHHRIKCEDFGGYYVKATGFEGQNPSKLNQINACIKDPYGKPYIPGSSLKGALRTIWINNWNKKDKDISWQGKDNLFNHIRVSDSQPVGTTKLCLIQKWDYSLRHGEAKPLPLVREAIKPMTGFRFTITAVDDKADIFVKNLMKASQVYYKKYKKFFLSKFPEQYIQEPITSLTPCYLGAGSGLWTKAEFKTMEYEKIARKTPNKMKMKGRGVLKLTKAPDDYIPINKNIKQPLIRNTQNLYEMGKCLMQMRKIER